MSSNGATIVDQDGDFADWLELYNPDSTAVDLTGWHLTNKAGNLSKWTIPSVSLPPGAFLVIFCSGKNYVNPAQPLATNFTLSDSGGYVALVTSNGATVISSYTFPALGADISYGISQPTSARETPKIGLLAAPTPGSANGGATNLLLAERNFVGAGANVLVGGFVITGPAGAAKEVLIRGVGPTLTQYGVTGVLAAPVLSVFDSTGKLLASNTGWSSNSNAAVIKVEAAAIGAFALPDGSADSALLLSLVPGAYTIQVSGVGQSTGAGLVEAYQVSPSGSQIINVSSRAQISAATGTLISGFVIAGGSAQVLVRAVGPALTQFSVPGVLAQPLLQVFDSTGKLIATNTGWGTNANSAQLAAAASAVGAFALATNSKDSALLLTLPAGAYTMQVSGVGDTTGTALAECYLVPSTIP